MKRRYSPLPFGFLTLISGGMLARADHGPCARAGCERRKFFSVASFGFSLLGTGSFALAARPGNAWTTGGGTTVKVACKGAVGAAVLAVVFARIVDVTRSKSACEVLEASSTRWMSRWWSSSRLWC